MSVSMVCEVYKNTFFLKENQHLDLYEAPNTNRINKFVEYPQQQRISQIEVIFVYKIFHLEPLTQRSFRFKPTLFLQEPASEVCPVLVQFFHCFLSLPSRPNSTG